jgi:1-acyl-sn-glycerol-3-phosphate acyltransferase
VQKSAEHADELAAVARRGVSLILFPEGTFHHRVGLLPFRTGAFQVAAQAGIPAIPVGLRGTRSLLREGTWYFRRSTVTVTFGEPAMPDGSDWAAAVRLRDRVRAEILKTCGEPDAA